MKLVKDTIMTSDIRPRPEPESGRFSDIDERIIDGHLILSLKDGKPGRKLLFINVSGGRNTWADIKCSVLPTNRLWGCVELVRMGYEVAVAEALPDFYWHRKPVPHDLRLLRFIRKWLGADGVVYCAHNTLYWLPMLRRLGLLKQRVVSLLYAREPLNWARGHDGIIALTPPAAEHARTLAPQAKIDCLGWGMDLEMFPMLPYRPQRLLVCGRTHRDNDTLRAAAEGIRHPIRIINHAGTERETWPASVELVSGGTGWERRLSYQDLVQNEYAECTASLVIVQRDNHEYIACGFTGIIEAMALGRPVIATRTGAVPAEIDLEKLGCGIYVPPEDSRAIVQAVDFIVNNPDKAAAMGQQGRKEAERYYNAEKFGKRLHAFLDAM